MPINEWNVVHAKHQIRVVKTPTDGARLYVDDELLDTTNDLYASEGEATLVGVFGEDDEFRVEAFLTPSEHAEAEIRVNGEWISGDKVYAVASD
jgi:hypothetical protein